MRKILSLAVILLCSFTLNSGSKDKYPKTYFRSPVDFPILLAGSFGEVRPNHFHSGIDIRTGGEQGKPVHAAADGYVSRISVSPFGFGKAIYITHPNGYTTVYGHLRNFNTAIGSWTRYLQYNKESFAIDVPVNPDELKVKKGDVIAYSGNSGSSGGPHLHFEIRDAATQEIINPLLFGLELKDYMPPRIYGVKIYPKDESGLVNFSNKPLYLPVTGSSGKFNIKSVDSISVCGNIIFGIETKDFTGENGGKDGISSIELYIDTAEYFSQNLTRFAFSDTRYVNSLIDYPVYAKSDKPIFRSYIAPNDKLNIFGKFKTNGVVNFNQKGVHKVTYVVRDVNGNSARLEFPVKSHPPAPVGARKPASFKGTFFSCSSVNNYKTDDMVFQMPKDALYDDLDFLFYKTPALPGTLSPVFHLHNDQTPIHSYCSLDIKPNAIKPALTSKAMIVKIDSPGHYSSKGGRWMNGFVSAQIREFGDYTVMLDTTAPTIRPVNIADHKNVSRQNAIIIRITDNLSGIESYRGTINGKWILMDYDAKTNTLIYTFDNRISPGKNEFRLVVRDVVGNEAVYRAVLLK